MSKRGRRSRWANLLGAGGAVTPRSGASGAGNRSTPLWRAYDWTAQSIDRCIGWDKVGTPLGLAVLLGIRNILRRNNLVDTSVQPGDDPRPPPTYQASFVAFRSADGSYNDLAAPTMGMANRRFGRNVPLAATAPTAGASLMEPNPRTVSLKLLTRHNFIPAPGINLLAATWIQFMVKDWMSHGPGDRDNPWTVELASEDPWREHQNPMTILRTKTDCTRRIPGRPPTFINYETPWWDASQIYGTTPDDQNRRRSHSGDGKLATVGSDGLLRLPVDPNESPAYVPGWWLGLNMMETLFILEHNALCDHLHANYPRWTDEQLFQHARLVVCALIAKIHTTEWTPAIIAHPTTVAALRANWWGLASEGLRKRFGRIFKSEVLSGIPGSDTDHFGVPYSLTEEFSIVYRMHSLIPDDYEFRSACNDSLLEGGRKKFPEIAGIHAQEITAQIAMTDIFYSFGIANPGALVLNNYPKSLQEFYRPDNDLPEHRKDFMDLAATDVLRARELGVPRYNELRRLLHLKPARSFDELSADTSVVDALRGVYRDIEDVDVMVGMFAERRPEGFAFSDTAFRIFVLMASRRLNSDRFLSHDFRPEVYTPLGINWVQYNTFGSVVLRHYPRLEGIISGHDNAFKPWTRVDASRPSPSR